MNSPISPDAPHAPYWPISAGIDWIDADFDRQHAPYIESP